MLSIYRKGPIFTFLKGIGYEDVVNQQRAKDFFDQKKGLSETIRTRHRVNKPFGTPLHFQVTTPKRWKRRDRNQDRESWLVWNKSNKINCIYVHNKRIDSILGNQNNRELVLKEYLRKKKAY